MRIKVTGALRQAVRRRREHHAWIQDRIQLPILLYSPLGVRAQDAVCILGLRHEEQRNALQSVARDQKNIHSLMLLNDQDYLVWMAGGAVYRVPSLQVNCLFTSVFVEKIR
jgi:hypothetical protein